MFSVALLVGATKYEEVVIKYSFGLLSFAFIFGLLYVSVIAGQILGKWHIAYHPKHKLRILAVAEAAVLTLLGLLIAFSFSGAYQRFEAREIKIIDEANAIYTAYLRLDLLVPAEQKSMREMFRQYVNVRMHVYDNLTITDYGLIGKRAEAARELQHGIWNQAILALGKTNKDVAYELLLPALNDMFEASNSQFILSKLHPPSAVFILLGVIALLSSFLTGYSTAKKKYRSHVYILSYLLIVTVTLFITFNLELPRIGMLRVTSFDKVITNINDQSVDPSGAV